MYVTIYAVDQATGAKRLCARKALITDCMTAEEAQHVARDIAEHGHAFIGGGAAQLYRIEQTDNSPED